MSVDKKDLYNGCKTDDPETDERGMANKTMAVKRQNKTDEYCNSSSSPKQFQRIVFAVTVNVL